MTIANAQTNWSQVKQERMKAVARRRRIIFNDDIYELDREDERQLLLDVTVKPGLRHLETKLVVQHLGRGGDQAARLAKQADQPAVVN